MRRTPTLEQLLEKEQDIVLVSIYTELISCVVPHDGYAHTYCRKVNKMIDEGWMCVRQDNYRKIYVNTLAKALMKELAKRYVIMVQYNDYMRIAPTMPIEEFEQLKLPLDEMMEDNDED